MHIDDRSPDSVTSQCHTPQEFSKGATSGKQICIVSGHLSWFVPYMISTKKCCIKGQGFGNKMHVSELFTIFGSYHLAGFKNHRETFYAKGYVSMHFTIFLKMACLLSFKIIYVSNFYYVLLLQKYFKIIMSVNP